MGQLLLLVFVTVFFAAMGFRLILWPEDFLAKLGRPATTKHVRATRFIGALFLLFVISALSQWFRHPG
jgi:hypothetical protein